MGAQGYQLIVIAGGYGKGLRHRTLDKIPKCLLKVNEKPLVDYCLELYFNNSFKEAILLLGHLSDKVIEHTRRKYGERVRYSVEKEILGKGGAIKYALDNQVIEKNKPAVICYPDDVILKRDFPQSFLSYHEEKVKEGAIATAVCIPRVRFRYGVLKKDERNFVFSFEEKPWINQVVNVGTYAIQPEVFEIVEKIDLKNAPIDFESVVVKEICEKRKLACYMLDPEHWVPFNDEKDFEDGEKKLKSLNLASKTKIV